MTETMVGLSTGIGLVAGTSGFDYIDIDAIHILPPQQKLGMPDKIHVCVTLRKGLCYKVEFLWFVQEETMVKYLLYVLRWVVLAVPGALFFSKAKELLGLENVYIVMVISQGVMGAMVYFLDRLIFTSGVIPIPWEIKPRGTCAECGRVGKCYRVGGERCCEIQGKANEKGFICENCAVKKIQHIND